MMNKFNLVRTPATERTRSEEVQTREHRYDFRKGGSSVRLIMRNRAAGVFQTPAAEEEEADLGMSFSQERYFGAEK